MKYENVVILSLYTILVVIIVFVIFLTCFLGTFGEWFFYGLWMVWEGVFSRVWVNNLDIAEDGAKIDDLMKTLQIPMKTKVGQPETNGKFVTKSV